MGEEWRPIIGYEGLYEVSNTGKVRRVHKTVKNKEIKLSITRQGYISVCLCKDNVKKNKRVHRLVAKAFIPNPENKPDVNHIDCNKTNNHVSNLEWVTRKENTRHSMIFGGKGWGEKAPNSKLKEKDVLFIRESNLSRKELAKMFNVSEMTIYNVVTRKHWNITRT